MRPGEDDELPPRLRIAARIAAGLGSIAAAGYVVLMLIAAGPGSDTMGKVYPMVEPALDVLNIDNEWGFFAPNPDPGNVVRYRVTDINGKEHEFKLTEALDRWDPMFLRYTTLYMSMVDHQDDYEVGGVRFLCRRHATMGPKEIAIVVGEQDVVTPTEFREGRRILDDLHIEVREPVACNVAEGFE